MIINFNCIFCGEKQGQIEINDADMAHFGYSGKETPADLGFADIRCDTHKVMYGDFSTMVHQAIKVLGNPLDAEAFVKLYLKQDVVSQQLALYQPAIMKK